MVARVRHKPTNYERYRLDENDELYYYMPNHLKQSIGNNNAWKKVMKATEVIATIIKFHTTNQSAYQGINKMYLTILNRYYCPGMLADIKRYVNDCEVCLKCKPDNSAPQELMYPRKITEPWETVSLDIMGPFQRSKSGKR